MTFAERIERIEKFIGYPPVVATPEPKFDSSEIEARLSALEAKNVPPPVAQ